MMFKKLGGDKKEKLTITICKNTKKFLKHCFEWAVKYLQIFSFYSESKNLNPVKSEG